MRRERTITTAGRARSALVFAGLLAVSILATAPAWAASEAQQEAVTAAEESFRVLTLEDGWLLEPIGEDAGFSTLEVKENSFAIDGDRISEDELRARLGNLADAVVALSDVAGDDEFSNLEERERERSERVRVRALERAERARERAERRARGSRDRSDSQVVVGNSLHVEEDDVYRDVVVFGGRLTVDGQVIGDAVAIGGSATVSGEITGDLSVVGGSIELQDGAKVLGDVVSVGGEIEEADDVDVGGQIIEVPFAPNFNFGNFGNWGNWGNWSDWGDWDSDFAHDARRWGRHARWFGFFEAGWELLGVLFCGLLACLFLLIARNPVERIARKVSDEPWKSGLVGLLTQILCLPVLVLVCFVLLVSIIGIPLLLLVPFAILGFILLAFLGYTAVAYLVGGLAERRFDWSFGNPYLTLLLGVVLVEIVALVGEFLSFGPGPIRFFAAMFVLFGCLLIYVVWTLGLGGAILTRFGTWGDLMGPPPLPAGPGGGYDVPDVGAYGVTDDLSDMSQPSEDTEPAAPAEDWDEASDRTDPPDSSDEQKEHL